MMTHTVLANERADEAYSTARRVSDMTKGAVIRLGAEYDRMAYPLPRGVVADKRG